MSPFLQTVAALASVLIACYALSMIALLLLHIVASFF